MKKYKIVFLCNFSNNIIRNRLILKKLTFRNILLKMRRKTPVCYDDSAIWDSDLIQKFEKHQEFEFHVVAPHKGMKRKYQEFDMNGIYYHFFKCDSSFFVNVFHRYLHTYEKNDYRHNRHVMKRIIGNIQPNLLMLCGAENPKYSIGVLDVNDIPVYVILQTLLNDKKRIEMGVGSFYRRKVELDIFRHAHYFSTTSEKSIQKIKEVNNDAVVFPVRFPTHCPIVSIPKDKEYDFVFFARNIKKNKGIEDVLYALTIVKNSYSDVKCNLIGGCEVSYRKQLDVLISKYGLEGNVHFAGYYDNIDDTYANVVKAKAVVVPGLTAGLNSTVRESMLMGLPTICYETSSTIDINHNNVCLLTAKMDNVEDLAKQMIYVLDNPDQAETIAKNGKDYADRAFSNESIVNKMLDNCRKIIEKKV